MIKTTCLTTEELDTGRRRGGGGWFNVFKYVSNCSGTLPEKLLENLYMTLGEGVQYIKI